MIWECEFGMHRYIFIVQYTQSVSVEECTRYIRSILYRQDFVLVRMSTSL